MEFSRRGIRAVSLRTWRSEINVNANSEWSEFLKARWLTPNGKRLQQELIERIQANQRWDDILTELPGSVRNTRHDDLRGIRLVEVSLAGCELTWCALDFANFECCDLSGSNLGSSYLTAARFQSCNLSRAGFFCVAAPAAHFSNCNLQDSMLGGSNFRGACFVGTSLRRAVLSCCDLCNADFSRADLTDAELGGSRIDRHTLENTKLDGARLDHMRIEPD